MLLSVLIFNRSHIIDLTINYKLGLQRYNGAECIVIWRSRYNTHNTQSEGNNFTKTLIFGFKLVFQHYFFQKIGVSSVYILLLMIFSYKIQYYNKIIAKLIFKKYLDYRIFLFPQQNAYRDMYRIWTIILRYVSYRDLSVSLLWTIR